MSRLFLSGQMTCAMLLGAGLLLRAQARLRPPPSAPVAVEAPRTRPSELLGERDRTAPRVLRAEGRPAPRVVQKSSHKRKGFAHRAARRRARKCGAVIAGRWLRCG